MNRKRAFVLFYLIMLVLPVQITAAIDNDDDRQDFGLDCNDTNYYVYAYAPQIPFDGITNDCRLGN